MNGNRVNFTIQAVEKLACPPDLPAKRTHTYFYDTKRAGLCVLVTRTGHKSFYVYRKINGRPERVRLGTFPPMTVDQARDACDRIHGKVADGANPAEDRRTANREQTLGDV